MHPTLNIAVKAALRAGKITGTLTAVTTVGTITNFGTAIPAKEMADDINNFTVTLANINNVTA